LDLYKNKYRTDSIRLKGWDYRNSGRYFVTICTKNRQNFFGHIRDGMMGLSQTGIIAHWFWMQIPQHFPHIILDEYIVMPNHVHGIIGIINGGDDNVETLHATSLQGSDSDMARISPKPGALGTIIRSYKSAVTRQIRKKGFKNFAWQPRFHDHIIRNEQSLERIETYIFNNPLKWKSDTYFKQRCD
jgi:REP element-mobilizing transposase RayT